jgi:GNAT superfamily N-acetyltransferase
MRACASAGVVSPSLMIVTLSTSNLFSALLSVLICRRRVLLQALVGEARHLAPDAVEDAQVAVIDGRFERAEEREKRALDMVRVGVGKVVDQLVGEDREASERLVDSLDDAVALGFADVPRSRGVQLGHGVPVNVFMHRYLSRSRKYRMLRLAMPDDTPHFQRLFTRCHQEAVNLPALDPTKATATWEAAPFAILAEKDGDVIGGFAANVSSFWFSAEPIACETFTDVLPEARGSGAGLALYGTFLRWAKKLGHRAVLANSCGLDNERLERVFAKLGLTKMCSQWLTQ